MVDDRVEPIFVDDHLFLGRLEEQKQFRYILHETLAAPPGETLPYIMLLYGDGGIGKTTLLRRFWQIAHQEEPFAGAFRGLWLDWDDLRRHTPTLQGARELIEPEVVLDLLHKTAVNEWGDKYFKHYPQVVQERIEAEAAVAVTFSREQERDEAVAKLADLGTTGLAKFIRLTLPVGEAGEVAAKTLLDAGIEMGAGEVSRLRTALTDRLQRYLKPEQFRLFSSPLEHLAKALGRDLQGLTQGWRGKPLLLALDTYEIVDHNDIWLRQVVQVAGPKIVWVISGRNNLADSRLFGGENFVGYRTDFPRRLQAYNLGELALADLRAYFAHTAPERPLADEEALALTRVTRGIPLAIREAAAMWRTGAPLISIVGEMPTVRVSHAEIVARMTERYLRYALNSEADRLALYALALAEGEIEQLQAMLRPDTATLFDLEARLGQLARAYASVHLETARLHDAATQFIQAYLRLPLRRQSEAIRQLNEKRTAVLTDRLTRQGEGFLLEERCDDEDWQQTVLHLTRALFWLDEERAWRWLIPHYVAGLAYSVALQRGLVETAVGWQDTFSANGRKRLKLLQKAEGIMRGSGNSENPLDILERFVKGIRTADNEGQRELLQELQRLARAGWLVGADEAELRAILGWQQGKLLYRQKQYEEALAAYQQAATGLPAASDSLRKRLANDLYYLSNQLIWPDNAPSTVPTKAGFLASELAVTLDKTHGGAYYNYAVASDDLGDKEMAVVAYQKAIEIEPRATRYNGLGTVCLELGRFEVAIHAYEQAITLDPKDSYPHFGLGSAYLELGQHEAAIHAYEQAVALDPQYRAAHTALSTAYRAVGQMADYQKHLDLAQELMTSETA